MSHKTEQSRLLHRQHVTNRHRKWCAPQTVSSEHARTPAARHFRDDAPQASAHAPVLRLSRRPPYPVSCDTAADCHKTQEGLTESLLFARVTSDRTGPDAGREWRNRDPSAHFTNTKNQRSGQPSLTSFQLGNLDLCFQLHQTSRSSCRPVCFIVRSSEVYQGEEVVKETVMVFQGAMELRESERMESILDQPRLYSSIQQILLGKDLFNPLFDLEKRQHKKKRLVQSPNSYFMDVKCPGCYKIRTVFSHAQTVVLCVGCSTVLCQPTGGKARLTEGCSFRRKQH
ncbi:hypothetical protein SKAU_G00351300 [Synaphobranchus kaupii]|uniref:40S ribosomal protein S27 n=1 Tax=Synaphobranchus kaupii TaxID=118154 RepID=A0A9Q1EKJ3_SYNKA|nr:hypothetical protein SKAU_G00351300 [Synaphobranchus kaupii]